MDICHMFVKTNLNWKSSIFLFLWSQNQFYNIIYVFLQTCIPFWRFSFMLIFWVFFSVLFCWKVYEIWTIHIFAQHKVAVRHCPVTYNSLGLLMFSLLFTYQSDNKSSPDEWTLKAKEFVIRHLKKMHRWRKHPS